MFEVRYGGQAYSSPSVSEALAVFRRLHGQSAYLVRSRTNRGWRVEIKREGQIYYLGDIRDPRKHNMNPAHVRVTPLGRLAR